MCAHGTGQRVVDPAGRRGIPAGSPLVGNLGPHVVHAAREERTGLVPAEVDGPLRVVVGQAVVLRGLATDRRGRQGHPRAIVREVAFRTTAPARGVELEVRGLVAGGEGEIGLDGGGRRGRIVDALEGGGAGLVRGAGAAGSAAAVVAAGLARAGRGAVRNDAFVRRVADLGPAVAGLAEAVAIVAVDEEIPVAVVAIVADVLDVGTDAIAVIFATHTLARRDVVYLRAPPEEIHGHAGRAGRGAFAVVTAAELGGGVDAALGGITRIGRAGIAVVALERDARRTDAGLARFVAVAHRRVAAGRVVRQIDDHALVLLGHRFAAAGGTLAGHRDALGVLADLGVAAIGVGVAFAALDRVVLAQVLVTPVHGAAVAVIAIGVQLTLARAIFVGLAVAVVVHVVAVLGGRGVTRAGRVDAR